MAEKPKKSRSEDSSLKEGEKIFTIPLRHKILKSPRNYRMNRSVREIRAFLSRHMKVSSSDITLSQRLNEFLWKGGMHNPPSKIRVKAGIDDEGRVLARLPEEVEIKEERKAGLRERFRKKESEKGTESPIQKQPSEELKNKAAEEEKGKKPSEESVQEMFQK